MSSIEFPCLEIAQPIGVFYIGVMAQSDLIEISKSDVIHIDKDERDIETVSGLERPISRLRVKELQEYVKNIDAAFPTGVIIAVSAMDVEFDRNQKVMKLRRGDDVATIIDGQHRIEGLKGLPPTFRFDMNVTIFVDMDPEDQAAIFSTINLKQVPVSKSITYELFEYARSRSPQKTCHQIARRLNQSSGSPFKDKIMILGVAHDKDKETLTQAAFIKPLEKLIVPEKQAMADRDALKRGRHIPKPTEVEVRTKRLVFRSWFLDDQDSKIAQTIVNYFAAVEAVWPKAWGVKTPGLVLNRTTGYNALMRVLPLLLFKLGIDEVHSIEDFASFLSLVTLTDDDFNPNIFKPGSSGEAILYQRLLSNMKIDESQPWKGLTVKSI
ncbi:DGQHR domain-containing protein [Terriglobus saanensis]|uniref:DGQHR domain protein n=1 Tax=Terriglobus saanensis (strain ATCC BAA-1853 / DSM 23119 / SP1PR4) TaxID=401053 RepID=E8UXC3_TERSS|nr:DGQHR domain-containing protein [Terriglobus saanensis]ADV84147.1 DGQHR domain protein [Terriglobus saanensis SP1PR4]